MVCYSCKKDKEENEFSFRNKKLNIRGSKCKECHRDYVKKHYQKNKSSYIEKSKINRLQQIENNKKLITEYLLSEHCVDCGENDIRTLDFDHINPDNKESAVTRMMFDGCGWEKISKEIKKCEIRCANCHRKRTADQFNTYRNKIIKSRKNLGPSAGTEYRHG